MADFIPHSKASDDSTGSTILMSVKASSQLPEEMKTFLLQHGMIPTESDIALYKIAFAKLCKILLGEEVLAIRNGEGPIAYSSTNRGVSLVMAPTGSYAMDVWDTTSEIDCLCIGSCSNNTFYSLARQRLRKEADPGLKVLLADKDGSGSMLEVEIQGVKLNLQYCQSRFAESWSQLPELPPEHHLLDVPIATLKTLNSYRDVEYLLRTLPDLGSFRPAHRIIKAWARERGLYSSKFGYLGDQHITLMLSRICKRLSRGSIVPSATVVVRKFFAYFAAFDFKREIVSDQDDFKPRYQRSQQESMIILTICSPVINIATNVSTDTVRTIIQELKRADKLMAEDNLSTTSWQSLIQLPQEISNQSGAAIDFLRGFETFIRIDLHYWGASTIRGGRLVAWIDGKCTSLLADIKHDVPDLHTRIWPFRFTSATDTDQGTIDDYRSFYLIGLARADGTTAHSNTERRTTHAALQTTIETFTAEIHNDTRYDPNTSFVDICLKKQADLPTSKIRPDTADWGRIADDQTLEPPSEDDDEDDEDDATPKHIQLTNPQNTNLQRRNPQHSTTAPKAKLRPASDILSRLRWDPSLSHERYTIGYLDRFAGVKEVPLEAWKGDSSEEDFVPGHRILWFRREGDGVLVWEREGRVDLIFGSGNGKAGEGIEEAEV